MEGEAYCKECALQLVRFLQAAHMLSEASWSLPRRTDPPSVCDGFARVRCGFQRAKKVKKKPKARWGDKCKKCKKNKPKATVSLGPA